MSDTYRPLPSSVTVGPSEIEGLGLFAVELIPAGTCLGITHVHDPNFSNEYIRTPLGGFYNHSDNPNCKAVVGYQNERSVILLTTLRDVEAGEEITSRYWLYAP